ncbi:hypothetical protein HDV02_005232 [Globomyces sp. JEL0801]|nr:hypothetical protein HDV02_005232 [Globomyces sp. JEL0801]
MGDADLTKEKSSRVQPQIDNTCGLANLDPKKLTYPPIWETWVAPKPTDAPKQPATLPPLNPSGAQPSNAAKAPEAKSSAHTLSGSVVNGLLMAYWSISGY